MLIKNKTLQRIQLGDGEGYKWQELSAGRRLVPIFTCKAAI